MREKATAVTHSALVRRAAKWLRGRPAGCRIVLNDVRVMAVQEQPDVIGWRGNGDSVLVECKASKADLRVDRHKPWRRDPTIGMGRQRWLFISEEAFRGTGRNVGYDSIGSDWGIAYWSGKGAPRVVRRPGTRARAPTSTSTPNGSCWCRRSCAPPRATGARCSSRTAIAGPASPPSCATCARKSSTCGGRSGSRDLCPLALAIHPKPRRHFDHERRRQGVDEKDSRRSDCGARGEVARAGPASSRAAHRPLPHLRQCEVRV